jgi:hypothetical protein
MKAFKHVSIFISLILLVTCILPADIVFALGPPTANTNEASSVTKSSAVLNGVVTANGGYDITEYGFYYCVYGTGDYTKVKVGTSILKNVGFIKRISGLDPDTKYSFYAYAKNSAGESTPDSSKYLVPKS